MVPEKYVIFHSYFIYRWDYFSATTNLFDVMLLTMRLYYFKLAKDIECSLCGTYFLLSHFYALTKIKPYVYCGKNLATGQNSKLE